jgi:Na+/melibiose symporter-like transporter
VAFPPPVDEPSVRPAAGVRKQLDLGHSLAFASLGIPTAIAALMLNTYMPRFYAGREGLTLASVAAVFGLARLIDIPFDPMVGVLIDRTRVAFGRYRLWLLCSVPLILAATWGLFMPPAHAGAGYLLFWLLVDNAGYSIMVLSYYSWAASLAPRYAERARLFGFLQSLSVLGAVGVLLLPLFTHGRVAAGAGASMGFIGWVIIATMPLCVGIVAVFTPERPIAREVRHSVRLSDIPALIARPNVLRLIAGDFFLWLVLSLTAPIRVFFLKDAKGLSIPEISLTLIFLLASGAFGAPIWSRVAARIGKHGTILVACGGYTLCHLTLVFLPRLPPHHGLVAMAPIAAALFAIGFCGIAFPTLVRAMAGDAADEILLEKGVQRTSLLYSMISTTTKSATALGVATFPVLAMFHFRPTDTAVNTPHAVFGLVLIYCVSPLVFLLLGALAFSNYSLDAVRHGEIREALDRMEA